jgi:DNA polymerase III epsilon subunit-like protein
VKTKQNKKLFIDVETTGLDPLRHGITEISAIVEIDGIYVDSFSCKMRPSVKDEIDPEALLVQGITEEELRSKNSDRLGPNKAFDAFLYFMGQHVDQYDKTDKFTVYEYSVGFDFNFVSEWFKKQGNTYWGSFQNYRPVHVLAMVRYLDSINASRITRLTSLKLQSVCQEFGIEIENPHSAIDDCKALHLVWRELEKYLIYICGGLYYEPRNKSDK